MHIVFAVHDAAATGAVIDVTRRQAEYLALHGDEVTLLTNRLPTVPWSGVNAVRLDDFIDARSKIRCFGYRLLGIAGRMRVFGGWRPWDYSRVQDQRNSIHQMVTGLEALHAGRAVNVCICCQHPVAWSLEAFRLVSNVPFVLVSHGDVFTHPLTAFSLPLRRFYRRGASHAYRSADQVYAVSRALADVAILHGASQERTAVLPNGLHPADIGWPPVRPAKKTRKNRLLCVGRLAAEKGHRSAIEALRMLHDLDVDLEIIGDGPCADLLKRRAIRAGVADRCIFRGSVSRQELGAAYAAADVLVQPSLAEGMGLTVVEALLCGVPVVASDIGGIPDAVVNGVNGFLVPPQRPGQIAEAVRRILETPHLHAEMCHHARQTGLKYQWESILHPWRENLCSRFNGCNAEKGSGDAVRAGAGCSICDFE